MQHTRIIVMAKAPVAGYAKTRLIPALGAAGAARLAQRLLNHAIGQALAAGFGVVELCCAPDALHSAFSAQAQQGGVVLTQQGNGDLGARMHLCVERGLAAATQVILIGTDAPALDAATLRAAAAALEDSGAVLAPAADGGYALIGLRRAAPRLFEHMPWSTDRVLALTRERLAECGLSHAELPAVHDIDEPADLRYLPPGWL
jgi:rSAM/selenodomain-associated transferase 1